jgi:uncharacterized delta-60 repeat protein
MRPWYLPAITTVLMIAWSQPAVAAGGDLDTTFGGDGRVLTSFSIRGDAAESVAIQSDGKIVAAGFVGNFTSAFKFALARYNTDGSLDTSFSGDGEVLTSFTGTIDIAQGVVIQPDGKIVAAGGAGVFSNNPSFALARYNSDGSLDTTFSSDGKLTTDFTDRYDAANDVVLQTDGKIVAAGDSRNDFALARYNSDGSLDTTFGGDGKVTTNFPNGGFVSSVGLLATGEIVVAGECFCVNGAFGLALYNTDGSLHTSFGGNGKVTTDFTKGEDWIESVAVQADGRIVAGGVAGYSADPKFALARYHADGSLDLIFGRRGKRMTDFTKGDDFLGGIAIQSDGKIVAAGEGLYDFAVARYGIHGRLDMSFGGDGKVRTDFGGSDGAASVAIQADGKIVAAGRSGSEHGRFALARYLAA